jgi:DNA-binding transcriptional LysR family regulator
VIELRQLPYLLATAEAGSFSRAARNLNIKQSPLSRHILQIEKRLGMALERRGRRLIERPLEKRLRRQPALRPCLPQKKRHKAANSLILL